MAHPSKKLKRMKQKAKLRAAERFGLELSDRDLAMIVRQIRYQESIFVMRSTKRVSLHIVKHNGTSMPVVYDKHRGALITILPRQVLRKWLNYPHVQKKLQGV
jgi:hypothetical protein